MSLQTVLRALGNAVPSVLCRIGEGSVTTGAFRPTVKAELTNIPIDLDNRPLVLDPPRASPTHPHPSITVGHAIVAAAGGKVSDGHGASLRFGDGRNEFIVPDFIAWGRSCR